MPVYPPLSPSSRPWTGAARVNMEGCVLWYREKKRLRRGVKISQELCVHEVLLALFVQHNESAMIGALAG